MNDMTPQIANAHTEAAAQYEPPTIADYGTLLEMTAGHKSSSAPDQIVGAIPVAFS